MPREVGAKLMLCADGQIVGTIGGGAGEAKVLRQAEIGLTTGAKQQVAIDLSGSPQREIQGICGGQMQVWVEPWQGEEAITLAQQIVQTLEQGQPIVLSTPLDQTQSPYLEIGIDQGPNPRLDTPIPTFQVTLQPPPTLLIVGAGHCGIQLARVADLIGFQVIVQDDRPSWANRHNFPQANRVFNQALPVVAAQLAHHHQLYAALVTRGFDYDLPALKVLLKRSIPCRYIGMIGSRQRVRKALQALQLENIPPDRWATVFAPIGLDIGALTPEEIAVSISAELILVHRGGTGKPLSALI